MNFLVGDPRRATPQYTRFAILAALGRVAAQRNGSTDKAAEHRPQSSWPPPPDNHPGRRESISNTEERVEWPPLETDSIQRTAANPPPGIDAARFNAAISEETFGAPAVSVKRRFDSLRAFRSGPAIYRVRLANGSCTDVVFKASLRGLDQEARFYQELSPRMEVHVPRLLGVLPGLTRHEPNWLAMELVRGQVFASTMTEHHLRAAARALADLHAQFWGGSLAQRYNWLPVVTDSDPSVFSSRLQLGLDAIWSRQHSLEFFPKLLTREIKLGLDRIGNDLDRLLTSLRDLTGTLLHGDLSQYNVIFSAGSASDPEGSVFLLDWQDVCWGPAVVDLLLLYHTHLFRNPYHPAAARSAPLIQWDEFANYYFDALEQRLGRRVDREKQIAAAPVAGLCLALRKFLVCAGLTLSAGQLDFLYKRKGWLRERLAVWADLPGFLEYFVHFPIELVIAHAPAVYGRKIFV